MINNMDLDGSVSGSTGNMADMTLEDVGIESMLELEGWEYDYENDSGVMSEEVKNAYDWFNRNINVRGNLNQIIQAETKKVLEVARQLALPSSDAGRMELEDALLNAINKSIDLRNVNCDKAAKLKPFECLPDICIAKLMIDLEWVRLLKRSASAERKNCQLAMYQWNGKNKGLYDCDETVIIRRIRKYHYSITAARGKAILQMLHDEAPMLEVGKDANLIAVNNGIFNYETKELMEFSPDFIFTSKTSVDFIENALNVTIHNDEDGTDWDVENWVKALSDNPEIVELLWQGIGATVRSNVRWNKTFLLYSSVGNNGKGTYCELLRNICGKEIMHQSRLRTQ